MRAVWAYRKSEQITPFFLTTAIASVLSWRKFAPQFNRIIYLDRKIQEILEEYDILKYFDAVEVDPLLEYLEDYEFWASAKAHVQVKQREPFWILDLDVVLLTDIDKWFKAEVYYGYGNINRLSKSYGIFKDSDIDYYKELYRLVPGYIALSNLESMINGGMVYYADPLVGNLAGFMLKGMQADYRRRKVLKMLPKGYEDAALEGPILEEGPLPVLFDKLKVDFTYLNSLQEERKYFRHYWGVRRMPYVQQEEAVTLWSKLFGEEFTNSKAVREWKEVTELA